MLVLLKSYHCGYLGWFEWLGGVTYGFDMHAGFGVTDRRRIEFCLFSLHKYGVHLCLSLATLSTYI